MPYNDSNIWIQGQRLYIKRSGEEWSFLGKDMGQVSYQKGRFWLEGTFFCYVDDYQHKRVIPTTDTGAAHRPDYYVAIDPQAWLWFAQPTASRQRRATTRGLHRPAHADHADQAAHNDTVHLDESAETEMGSY